CIRRYGGAPGFRIPRARRRRVRVCESGDRAAVASTFHRGLNGIELMVEACFDRRAGERLRSIVVTELDSHRLFCLVHLGAPVQCLDRLLRAERDEHTEHDDADFLQKLAEVVDRVWLVDFHQRLTLSSWMQSRSPGMLDAVRLFTDFRQNFTGTEWGRTPALETG